MYISGPHSGFVNTATRFAAIKNNSLNNPNLPVDNFKAQAEQAENVVSFLMDINDTKDLPRKGWLQAGITQPESVAAHSWSTAMLALLLTPKDMDVNKTVKYALLHDMAEAYVGDITPIDGISPEEASRLETRAVKKLCEAFPNLKKTWLEYENKATPEAIFCHQIDKLDMAMQALTYAIKGHNTREFIESARKGIFHPKIKAVFNEIVRRIQLTKSYN